MIFYKVLFIYDGIRQTVLLRLKELHIIAPPCIDPKKMHQRTTVIIKKPQPH